jgi:enoyl-CoA hydratase/carnithine racemase
VSALVLTERVGAVLVVRFNRPERANAWTQPLQDAYLATLDAADTDPGVRAIVVTGAGRTFCPGADMGALDALADAGDPGLESHEHPTTFPLLVRKPLIAAINGGCAGVGLVQALMCDVRFVAEEAKLTTSFARRGLVAEYGLAWLLERLVGRGRTADLLLSARVLLGTEATAIGLAEFARPADEVVAAAIAYATDLAEHYSPRALAVLKQQVWGDLHRAYPAALEDSMTSVEASFGWPDLKEGVASYVERRPPAFPPLGGLDEVARSDLR